MVNDMQNRALVAAAVAKQSGFDETYKALLEVIRQLEEITLSQMPEEARGSHREEGEASYEIS